MQVRMVRKILAPSVQHSSDARFSTKILSVSAKLQDCFGGGFEEQGIHTALVLIEYRIKLLRHSEYNVEVRALKQIAVLTLQPILLGECLALRAMAVAARIV